MVSLWILTMVNECSPEAACTRPFYCDRDILQQLGQSGIYKDSKSIVDLVMKDNWEVFGMHFKEKLKEAANDSFIIMQLVNRYFYQPDSELEVIEPPEFGKDMKMFDELISDDNYRRFAYQLNDEWSRLYRRQAPNINFNRTSFLKMRFPTYVPGGRFREMYYWDSYWTAKGALVCNLRLSVEHMIRNMLDYIEKYGFMPNGNRIYYTGRSQPPVLTLMIADYYQETKNLDFVREAIPLLDREYSFWLKHRTVKISQSDVGIIQLFQFRTNTTEERPEAFIEDFNTAALAEAKMGRSREQVFIDISSATESGWDFSSNEIWLAYSGPHTNQMYSIRTTQIVPVCLNSILCLVARRLGELHQKLNQTEKSRFYLDQELKIKRGIKKYMWDEMDSQWYDYDLEQQSSHKSLYASNYFPLWAQGHDLTPNELEKVIEMLVAFNLLSFNGGFITSTVSSGQQWDMPNAWPPLQDVIIEGLLNTGLNKSKQLAQELAARWLRNNWVTLHEQKGMFEKYSAVTAGYPGEGGEYDVQVGFGWTNGVALKYLMKYGSSLTAANPIIFYKIATAVLACTVIGLAVIVFTLTRRAKKFKSKFNAELRRQSSLGGCERSN